MHAEYVEVPERTARLIRQARAAERDADPWRAGDILAMGRDSGRPCGAGRLSVRGAAAGSVLLRKKQVRNAPEPKGLFSFGAATAPLCYPPLLCIILPRKGRLAQR